MAPETQGSTGTAIDLPVSPLAILRLSHGERKQNLPGVGGRACHDESW
jgi:hypothetical protein